MMGEEQQKVERRKSGRMWLTAGFLALALVAYCVPWMASSGASLSLNGYDLAEWSSLVPGVRYGAQPMVVPGLLRAQLIFAAAIMALLPTRRGSWMWWIFGACALALAIALLPPFEYFLEESWRTDVNYGQQVTFALLALINATICWVMPRGRPQRLALIVVAISGIVTAVAGVSQAVGLAAGYSMPATIGMGVVGYVAALAGAATTSFIQRKREISAVD
jgi:hypothetical protein